MRASITRTGGIAGLRDYLGAIDTDTASPEHAARVRHAVEDLLNRQSDEAEIGTDLFEYQIELTTESGEQTLTITDVGEPEGPRDPALAELVQAVMETT